MFPLEVRAFASIDPGRTIAGFRELSAADNASREPFTSTSGLGALTRRQDEEDERARDLARLHERIIEERIDPGYGVEGRGMEAPAVGRREDDPRHLPDSIHEEVGRDAEADEPEGPQPRCEA